MFSNSRVLCSSVRKGVGKYSQQNPHHTDHIWIYRQRNVDLLTVVNKLLIHKQPWKTWETVEVNQLHLTSPWVQDHEGQWERFLFFLCLVSCIHFLSCLVSCIHLLRWSSWTFSISVSCNPSFFFGGGVGDWFNALITSTGAWGNVYRDLCTSKRGDECGSPQYLKGKKHLQVSLHHVRKFQKAIGIHVDQFTVFYHSKCLVDCRIQPGSLKLCLAKK